MDDVIDMLQAACEKAGYQTVSAKLSEIQSGVLDLVAFVQEHRPVVIVYDIPRPYEANWNFLRLLRETDSLKHLGWVLTTTDKEALEAAVGSADDVFEIVIGKPYSVEDVIDAVRGLVDGDLQLKN
jgi:CheY-like chemotaxis protein